MKEAEITRRSRNKLNDRYKNVHYESQIPKAVVQESQHKQAEKVRIGLSIVEQNQYNQAS